MKTELIKFPAVNFRKIIDPELLRKESRSALESPNITIYVAVVDVRHLPDELEDWRGINPRDSNTQSLVSQKIRTTLDEAPENFLLRNRGLTLLVERANFDNKTNEVSLEFSNPGLHGLLDGGHTYEVIRDFMKSLPEEDRKELNALVKLEIIEGISERDAAINIVAARNTSAQVKDQSIANLHGYFDKIKKVLADRAYLQDISFKETEYDDEGNRKTIDIRDILSYLVCFDAERFSNDSHPILAYSQKNQVEKYFEEKQKELDKYVDLLPIILELHDRVYANLPDAYNRKTGGKFGRLTGVKYTGDNSRMSNTALTFIDGESAYRIPSGFIYPVLAAFRSAIKIEKGKAIWKVDPLKLLDDLVEELAQQVGKQAIEFRNPNKLGKDVATWNLCYYTVERALLIRNIR